MDFYESRTFTIGQFAALHGINKKTLMWYDEIGLLKPAFIRENGYRCYTFKQSAELETILMLRDLHVPLKEIAGFMEARSAQSLEHLLEEKLHAVDAEIHALQTLRTAMVHKKEEMHRLCSIDMQAITMVDKQKPRQMLLVPTTAQTSLNDEVERVLSVIKKHHLQRLYDASYGAMLPVEALYAHRFEEYTMLTVELPCFSQTEGLHSQPKGRYLLAYHKGAWEGLPKRYEEILAFAKREGLALYGHAYEKSINDAVVVQPEDNVTEIEIPVR